MHSTAARRSPADLHRLLTEGENKDLFHDDAVFDPNTKTRRQASKLFVTVLLFLGGSVLLLRLNTPTAKNVWMFPHATCVVGPDLQQCAQHALMTRTGIMLPADRFYLRDSTPTLEDPAIVHQFYVANLTKDDWFTVSLPADATAFRFFPEDALPPLSFT